MPILPNIRLSVPFFIIRDMQTSLNFYVQKLGFKITKEWKPGDKIEWCWLERESVALMLQEPRNKAEFNREGANGNGVSICFQCVDALALYHEFTANGIKIKEPFVGNNLWVVAFTDPDGYRLDFESPTDVPEETKYSEWFR
jgi:lactoylglutathione lyase